MLVELNNTIKRERESMAAVRGRVEAEVDMKISADQYYIFWRSTPHLLPRVCTNMKAGEIHEGKWDSAGSIRKWTYTIGKHYI